MFLHLCVILFTGGGGFHVQGGSVQGGVLCSGCLCPEGVVSVQGQVSVQGGFLSRAISVLGVSVREATHTATCGQYASYWNAFLFDFFLVIDSGLQLHVNPKWLGSRRMFSLLLSFFLLSCTWLIKSINSSSGREEDGTTFATTEETNCTFKDV